MFESARLKLTLFYLAILLAFTLTLTVSFRVIFENEYIRSNNAQRTGVQRLFSDVYEPGPRPYADFADLQDNQAGLVRQRLNRDFVLVNVTALALGGLLCYWFAGRTLKPIEEAHQAQARFASDASHELRTPLTNLRLENEVFLRQKSFSQAEARDLINSNLEEVQRLETLSANLLALTQYGNEQLKVKSTQIRQIANEAIKMKRKMAAPKKVTIHNETKPATIIGHRESLAEAISILLDNAIKYGPEGGSVTVGGKRADDHYLLWVQDQGAGIPEADMPHIFDRLYRGDKARSSKVSGYGLGLSLAKIIAKANNAEIKARNAPNGGACLMLRLPLAKAK